MCIWPSTGPTFIIVTLENILYIASETIFIYSILFEFFFISFNAKVISLSCFSLFCVELSYPTRVQMVRYTSMDVV